MKIYETTFVINPQTDDAGIEAQVKSISDIITAGGGKIIRDDHMGTRRLAYDIQGLSQGYYGGFIFESGPTLISTLDLYYRQNEEYLRHLTVYFPGTIEELEKSRIAAEGPERGRDHYTKRRPNDASSAPRPAARRRPEAVSAEVKPAKPEDNGNKEKSSSPVEETKTAPEPKPDISSNEQDDL